MITNIRTDKISPHPDNPRKDLGDLSELAESIKVNGILQNLTVVPYLGEVTGQPIDGLYRVVIGHRRLAAAKLAGLTEVPCAISNMNFHKQLSTMLLENMQRNDLTIWEQAQGFQMMLNFGDTVEDISTQTGLSETTVRRRVKLLDLDKDKFKKSVERGATLQEYAELDKIKDIKTKNSVLEKIGTPDFKWALQRAIDTEKNNINKALIIKELEKFAAQVESSNGLQYVASYSTALQQAIVAPVDVNTVEYFYYINSSGYVYLYKKSEANKSTAADPAWLTQQRERDEQRAALNEISKRAYKLRCEFIKTVPNTTAKKNMSTILEYLLLEILYNGSGTDYEELVDFLDIEIDEDDEDDEEQNFNKVKEIVAAQPERHLLVTAYLMLDSAHATYYGWDNRHEDNKELNTVYDFLEKLGYEASKEEQSLRDGTHELYIREDEAV
ncbi:ParB/RepB/Spo0J family partition protein [Sporomusa aerivorans]|uniref:ParB/RepB/Spo0J family partition protein n=1 Tax=Sporomusa aerivorans TaxID=204936 RepID=UPI00352A1F4A